MQMWWVKWLNSFLSSLVLIITGADFLKAQCPSWHPAVCCVKAWTGTQTAKPNREQVDKDFWWKAASHGGRRGGFFTAEHCPFPWGISTPSNTRFLGPTHVYSPVSIRSAVLQGSRTWLTDIHTDHATAPVATPPMIIEHYNIFLH